MRPVALFIFIFVAMNLSADPGETLLTVRVEGIRNSHGEVGVAAFPQAKGFPLRFERAYDLIWQTAPTGKDFLEFHFSLPPGPYAVSVLHDENSNRKMERSLFRFPREGVGFSNDQKVKLSAPSFRSCQFPLTAGEKRKITITLDYPK